MLRKHFASLSITWALEGEVPTWCWKRMENLWRRSWRQLWCCHTFGFSVPKRMSCCTALLAQMRELAVFWKSQMKSPQMTQELKRMIEASEPSQLPIPYVLHGDGAPFTEVDSVQVLSFRCLLARRSVSECQLLITAVPKLAMAQATFKQVVASVAWSWKVLFDGVCPKKDWQGKPIELHKGRRLRREECFGASQEILSGSAKNLDFLGLLPTCCAHTVKADQMKKGPKHSFTDFRPAASWRKTVFLQGGPQGQVCQPPLVESTWGFLSSLWG